TDPLEAIRKSYNAGKTDEFMLPVVITENGQPVAPMKDGDAVICCNYRSDRMRQIVRALIDPNFVGFDTRTAPIEAVAEVTNYANADMVGQSGSIPATIKAVETVDQSLARVLKATEAAGMRLIVTADHGNAEMLIDPETGGPHTAHTTNPVPFVVIDWEQEQ